VKPSATGVSITHRKKSTSPHVVRSAYASTTIGNRTGPRRALGVAAQLAKRGYRPDLRAVSIYLGLPQFIFDSPLLLRKPAFSLEPTGNAIGRHEGWVWTCLQDKSQPRWSRSNSSESSSYAIGARSMLGASRRRIGDDIATLFFTFSPRVDSLDSHLTDLIN
jgi:hypothetical protein